ncbi:MAG: DUF1016 N-terminal domain-containing protein [Thermoleophilia bacterium]
MYKRYIDCGIYSRMIGAVSGYGKVLVEGLAERLTARFGRGFTRTNLWYMRQFYVSFPILHALRGGLSWNHPRSLRP